MECEGEHDYEESKHKQGAVHQAYRAPAVEPDFAIPAQGVHGTPEAVREMEPDSSQPDDVEHHVNRAAEGLHDVSETVGGISVRVDDSKEFSVHHVVTEIEQV